MDDVPDMSSAAAQAALARAVGLALQAQVPLALQTLREADAAGFVGEDAHWRRRFLDRFERDAPSDAATAGAEADVVAPPDPWLAELLAAYRDYWWHALSEPGARAAHEAALADRLRARCAPEAGSDVDEVERALQPRLAARGLHGLFGVTAPLRELMLWTTQRRRRWRVALPEGVQPVTVELLDGFLVFGWAHYATCGLRATGGWATADALHAVCPRYAGLDDEAFRVSFLGHEAQHLADGTRFPGLPSWALEYRAKLAELALADATRVRLLQRFRDSQGDDAQASPHAYANRQVWRALRRRLGDEAQVLGAGTAALRRAAAEALREDGAARERART